MTERTLILVDAENVLLSEARDGVALDELIRDSIRHFAPVASCVVMAGSRDWKTLTSQLEAVDAPDGILRQQMERRPDQALEAEGLRLLPSITQLVIVSADNFFRSLIATATEAGKRAVVVSPMMLPGAGLSISATEVLTPIDLLPRISGLVAPGEGQSVIDAIIRHFRRARERVAVIDPYSSEETVRLMAVGAPRAALTLVVGQLSQAARDEAAMVTASGGQLQVFRSREVHDRWFAVDRKWFHSGGSLKDLGRRWSRVSEVVDERETEKTDRLLASLAIEKNSVLL